MYTKLHTQPQPPIMITPDSATDRLAKYRRAKEVAGGGARSGARGTIGNLAQKHASTGQELSMSVEALNWHSGLRAQVRPEDDAWGDVCVGLARAVTANGGLPCGVCGALGV